MMPMSARKKVLCARNPSYPVFSFHSTKRGDGGLALSVETEDLTTSVWNSDVIIIVDPSQPSMTGQTIDSEPIESRLIISAEIR